MTIDVVIADKIQASVVTKLRQISNASRTAHTNIERLKASLNIGSTGALGNVAITINRINSSANAAGSSLNRMNSSRFNALTSSLLSVNSTLTKIEASALRSARAFRTFVGAGLILGAGVTNLEKLDTFKATQNKLRPVANVETPTGQLDAIKSQERLNELTRQLFQVAQEARVPVDDLAKSYRRFDAALQTLGKSQQSSLDLTQTVAKSLTLAGANSNEASQTLLQLSQAFNKGKLDGDEFRTVAENIPSVIDAISTALGKNRSEIFDASKNGEISAKILVQAFESVKDTVDRDFASLPKTIGQSLTQLRNSVIQFFSAFDRQTGITDSIISFIDGLRNNLPEVVRYITAFGAALAALALPAFLGLIGLIGAAFFSIGGAIALATGYFTFFAKEIKVGGSAIVTLQDAFVTFVGKIPEFINSLAGFDIIESIFSAEGAQKAFDGIVGFISSIQDALRTAVATSAGFGEALGNSLFDATGKFSPENIIVEPFIAAFALINNAALDLVSTIVSGFEGPFIKLFELLDDVIQKIGVAVQAAGLLVKQFVPFGRGAGNGIFNAGSELTKGISVPKPGELGAGIKLLKTDIEEVAPTLTKFFDDWKTSSQRNYVEMKQQNTSFWDGFLNEASAVAEQRIELEKKVQEAMTPNPGALRGPGPDTTGGPGVAGSRGGINFAGDQRAQFTDEFKAYLGIANDGVSTLSQSFETVNPAVQQFDTTIASAGQNLNTLGQSSTTATTAVSNTTQAIASFNSSASGAFSSVTTAAESTKSSIDGIVGAAQAAGTAVSTFAQGAIADFNNVTDAANRAADASAGVGGGGGGFGGLFGFADGGYTGNIGTNRVAGVVHGQEFVVPAGPAAKYRPLLEAMRTGKALPTMPTPVASRGGAPVMTVNVENYGSSKIQVQQLSPNEIRIIAREEAIREAPLAVASQLRNPNSKVSKGLARNTKTERRR